MNAFRGISECCTDYFCRMLGPATDMIPNGTQANLSVKSAPDSSNGVVDTLPSTQKGIYFPGFTGLRFIAAWLVLVYHIEVIKNRLGFPNRIDVPFFRDCGNQAVTFFFVLSGFLITYLLFAEQEKRNTIDVKAFYIRRILRLWPVYYLVLVAAFFIWPNIEGLPMADEGTREFVGLQLLLYTIMLPNAVWFLPFTNFFAAHTWSIGVEEQFYLAWPALMKRAKGKRVGYLKAILGVIGGYLAIKFALIAARKFLPDGEMADEVARLALGFVNQTRFSCMGIGALGAWLLYPGDPGVAKALGRRLTGTFIFWGALLGAIAMLVLGWYVIYIDNEVNALLFTLIVMGVSVRGARMGWLEWKPIHYLGSVSYGFYMYHSLAIVFALYLFNKTGLGVGSFWGIGSDIALYVVATGIGVALSALSYELLERRMARLKGKFARVLSGTEAR
jgi:peptidoglycan/LPS O-acetylase OafA/YrhL